MTDKEDDAFPQRWDKESEMIQSWLNPPRAYTCVGKGGAYELVGTAKGAGTSRDAAAVVYRDTATGQLYFRTPADFADRMEEAKGKP
jgi:hypothetical protein